MTPPSLALPMRAVTFAPKSHFFGYYEKTPWDSSGRYLLALQVGFEDRRPGPNDAAIIGIVDLHDGDRWIPLAETRAWSWQQGAMLQWRPGRPNEILYNDRRDGRFVGIVLDWHTGVERIFPMPFYGVSPSGHEAVSLSFSRLADVRPSCGYPGVPDPWADERCPTEDGLHRIDMKTGETQLILSLAEAASLGECRPDMESGKHRFNHAQFNTNGSRFGVLHRWNMPGHPPWRTRLLTLDPDGSDPYVLADDGMVSHYDWRDAQTILAWTRVKECGNGYYLLGGDATDNTEAVGMGVLTSDGHCSYSPDPERRLILTDTYPDRDSRRTLLLYDTISGRRLDIGHFYGPTPADVETRCDLHPRWDRTGNFVCIDSIHEGGQRQVYVLDIRAARAALQETPSA